ncbi:MAG: hypothetical protein IJ892_09740 [Prevotella sp.]|nr:hypothetical protein [Prevotella sp.]MBR6319209.1 hypothetical protein [Prevotella sp.]
MKKVYLALMCMASLVMTTACGGDKKADKAADAESENTEMTADNEQAEEQQADEQEQGNDESVLLTPDKAELLNLIDLYKNGDFKPATNIIFVDTLKGETAGELPSKWDVKEGSAEVGEALGHKYIVLSGGWSTLFPMVGEGSKDYLPDNFTYEFEFLFGGDVVFEVQSYNAEEVGIGTTRFWPDGMEWNYEKTDEEGIHGDKGELHKLLNSKGWNHFALSFNKGNLKLFINGKRVANLPNIMQPGYITIVGSGANGESHFIKNVCIRK